MKRLYFVRHGQTEWNAVRRMQGRMNSDLSELGKAQADVNGQLLARLGIEAIYASPLDRTRQTAEIINRHLDVPVTCDERIVEWDCGAWSGFLLDEVAERWPDEWRALTADRFHYRGPACENYPDMFARARPFLAELERDSARTIAIVSHGMIGKVMVAAVLGLDEHQTLSIHQANDVVFHVTTDREAPDVHHYRAGEGPLPGLGSA